MKKLLLVILVAAALALPARAANYYLAGDFNGWDAAGTAMTYLGGGIWQANLAGVPGRHEFKVTVGDWTQNWPGSGNSWFLGNGAGTVILTFNTNTIGDGWRGDWGRIGTSTDPGTWTAVGDWQGWNNSGNAMSALGGGVYQYQQTLPAGWYQYRAVVTGSWDSIGDDFRGVNSNSTWFEVTVANPTWVFEVNSLAGTERVYPYTVPEPASLSLLVLSGLALLRRRR